MDATLGVEKIESSGIVRDGFDAQFTIRWEVNFGSVVAAVDFKTAETTVMGMPASYSERKPNIGFAMRALSSCAVFSGCLCVKKDGSGEKDEEDEGMHSLAMRNAALRALCIYRNKGNIKTGKTKPIKKSSC